MRQTKLPALAAIALAVFAQGAVAQETGNRRPPTKAEVAHAKRMIRALDDYDAQLERRMRQLKAEQRALERKARR